MIRLRFLIFCLLLLSNAMAQRSLKQSLDSLADKYNVHFLYEDKTISGKNAAGTMEERKKLEIVLNDLLQPLHIKWSSIDRDNYVIYKIIQENGILVDNKESKIQMAVSSSTKTSNPIELFGLIKDDIGKSIPFATVSLLKDSVLIKLEIADSSGSFVMHQIDSGKYSILVECVGFKSKILKNVIIPPTININLPTIVLKKAIHELNNVTVHSQKPIIKYEGNKLIFNVEASPLKEGYNALEVLARTPKLYVDGLGNLILRHSQPQVYINGRRQNLNGQDLTNFLQAIDASMIKSIEIQTTGLSNMDAGSNAGIVNIILKKVPNGFNGQISGTGIYRKGNLWGGIGSLSTNYGSQKWNLYSRFNYSETSDTGTYHAEKLFSEKSTQNLSTGYFNSKHNRNFNVLGGGVFYPNEKNQIGIEVYYKHGNTPTSFQEEIKVLDPSLNSVANSHFDEYQTSDNWYTALNYTLKTDEKGSNFKFISDFGRNWSNTSDQTIIHYSYGQNEDNSIKYIYDPTSNYYTFQGDFQKKNQGKFSYSIGAKYGSVRRDNLRTTFIGSSNGENWQQVENESGDRFKNKENILATYISSQVVFNDQNSLNAGLRMENTNFNGINQDSGITVKQNYIGFFPSFSFNHNLINNRNIVFSYARKISRPSFSNLNPFIRKENDYSYIMGNPNLKPAYYNSLELEYRTKTQSLDLYYMNGKQIINGIYNSEGNVTYYQPLNFGNQAYTGITYNFFSNITKWLYANFSQDIYHYYFKKDSAKINNNTFSSNLYLSIQLNKTLSLDISNLYIYKAKTFVVQTANYYRMDMTLQQKIMKGRASFRLYWNDVFNTSRDKNFGNYQLFNMAFYQKRVTQNFRLMFTYHFSNNQKIKDKKVESNSDIRNRL